MLKISALQAQQVDSSGGVFEIFFPKTNILQLFGE